VSVRLWLVLPANARRFNRRPFWSASLLASVIVASLAWGLGLAWVFLRLGLEDWQSLISLSAIAAICMGGTITFSPSLLYGRIHSCCSLLPAFLTSLYIGGVEGYTVATCSGLTLGFLLLQGKHLHESYWKGLADTELLRQKAKELDVARRTAEDANRAKSEFLAKFGGRFPFHPIGAGDKSCAARLGRDLLAQRRVLGHSPGSPLVPGDAP